MLFLLIQGCFFEREYTFQDKATPASDTDTGTFSPATTTNSTVVNTQNSSPLYNNSYQGNPPYPNGTGYGAITILEPNWVKYLGNSQGNQQECTQNVCMEQTYTSEEVNRYKEIDCVTTGQTDGWVTEEQINLIKYENNFIQKGEYNKGKCTPIKPKEVEPESTQTDTDEEDFYSSKKTMYSAEEIMNALIDEVCPYYNLDRSACADYIRRSIKVEIDDTNGIIYLESGVKYYILNDTN